MRYLVLAAALCLPLPAFAAGGNTWSPPTPTETTKTCKGKRVWDEEKGRCVRPKESSLNQDELFDALRELAYAGRNTDAQAVLAAMQDQTAARVLTYWGFTHRKLGNRSLANAYYEQAIAQNPDNLLARSYMGQGYVEEGQFGLALAQWQEIRARGGRDTWPETALRQALETGATTNY
ncbi:tetratricopeptide repeat protein [Pseudophaeobacter flagellatus]|uniref:tetratricopeptide repeat protein n=1 Tax=Pseudophaeobacter flagellatus TaxID=2899119 RepID=UPI001E2FBF83|nr:tetratricopeptide repeat protein [Pseudophaeobacter flagellatus]MCD9147637.1 tetratricopeptide repeat protein [Pseudophaeobacter flagellatus]